MKKLFLSVLFIISIQFVFAQTDVVDTIPPTISFFQSPAKGYKAEVMPKYKLYINIYRKKTDLKLVVMNSGEAGYLTPEIIYNKKARRNEYLLKTWWAGGGTNIKAWFSGSDAKHNRTVQVYKQEVDEQAPASKWVLVKVIKL